MLWKKEIQTGNSKCERSRFKVQLQRRSAETRQHSKAFLLAIPGTQQDPDELCLPANISLLGNLYTSFITIHPEGCSSIYVSAWNSFFVLRQRTKLNGSWISLWLSVSPLGAVLELVGTTLTPRMAPQKEKDNRTKAPVIFIGLLLLLNFVVSRFVFLYFA